MKKGKKYFVLITIFLISLFILTSFPQSLVAFTKYVHPDGNDSWTGISTFEDWDNDGYYDDGPYKTIEHALDEVWPNDIIKVADKAGLDPDYSPDAPLQLWHEDHEGVKIEWWNEGERPQIKGANAWEVFRVTVPNVTINGFDIYTDTGFDGPGILVTYSNSTGTQGDNCTISNNRCGYDATHRCNYGIELNQVKNVTIEDNVCSYNTIYGIYLWNYTRENTINDNITEYNTSCGMYIRDSNDNNIHDNTAHYHDDSGDETGIYFNNSDSNSVYSNTCDDNTTGMYIYSSRNNTISGNITTYNYSVGLALVSSYENYILGSTSEYNDVDGISLSNSNNNILYNNYCNGNYDDGIHIKNSSHYNSISTSTCKYNFYYGIHLENSDYNNISGNLFDTNDGEGVYLDAAEYNMIIGNNICDNGDLTDDYPQINLQNNSDDNQIYLNFFDWINNPVSSNSSSNTWEAPVKLSYLYHGLVDDHKTYMGNYYSDFYGSDTDDDGIGDTSIPYTTDGSNDNYPLIEYSLDQYDFKTWWLGNNETMYTGNMSKMGQLIYINAGSAYSWFEQNPKDMAIAFGDDVSKADNDWSGQIVFQTAPAVGDNFTIKIGYANDDAGTGFTYGPQATISGDGSTKIFTFTTDDTYLSVPKNKYIGVKLENNGSIRYYLRVGASWSYVASAYPITYPGTDISASSGNWEDSGIWGNNAVPTSDDDVIVQNGHSVTVNSSPNCDELILNDGANLLLNDNLPSTTNGYQFDSTSTVDYCKSSKAGNQTIDSTPIYGNLITSGNGTKTTDGNLQVNGNLSLSGSSVLTLAGDLDANGNINIGSGTTLNGESFDINISGDWTNNGTWNYGTSSVIFDEPSSEQTIGPEASGGTVTFYGPETFDPGWETNWSINVIQGSADYAWVDDNPGGRDFDAPMDETPWVICDSDEYGSNNLEATLTSPIINCSGKTGISLEFDHDFNNISDEHATVYVSNDGSNWTIVADWTEDRDEQHETFDISSTADNQSTVYIRFYYGVGDYDWWWAIDNVELTYEGSSEVNTFNFYNMTINTSGSPGTTYSQGNLHIHNNLNVDTNSELILGEYELTVDGTSTLAGPIKYCKTESPKNGITTTYTAGGMNVLQISPSGGDMGPTEVVVKTGIVCPDNAFGSGCTVTPLSIKRYFNISPTTSQTATVKFYYLTTELNGQNHGSAMKLYHWNSNSNQWEEAGLYVTSGGSGSKVDPYYVEYSGLNSYSPYTLGSEGDPSLPVQLSSFSAQLINNISSLNWTTQSETDNHGWYVYRSSKNNFSQSVIISDFIEGHGTTTEPQNYNFQDCSNDTAAGDTLYYWLKSLDFSGTTHLYAQNAKLTIPDDYEPPTPGVTPIKFGLYQNFPNPFSPSVQSKTKIYFCLQSNANAKIDIYNIKGQLVNTIYDNFTEFDSNDPVPKATYWDGRNKLGNFLSAGIYFYRLQVNNKVEEIKRMIILR